MCNYFVEPNRKCLIAKDKPLCHIHKNKKPKSFPNFILEMKIFDIEDNNIKLVKKIDKLNTFIQNQKIEITNLNNRLNIKNKQIKELTDLVNHMKVDYNNYQLIKQYELKKKNLIKNGIDIYNYNNTEFHNFRKHRNQLAHSFELQIKQKC